MRFIYVPVNTSSLISSGLATESDLRAMMNVILKRRVADEQVPTKILLYITHDSPGFREAIKEHKPAWATVETILRSPMSFSESEADALLNKKLTKQDTVVQIKAIPEGILSKRQIENMTDSMRSKWDFGFLYEIPSSNSLQPSIQDAGEKLW